MSFPIIHLRCVDIPRSVCTNLGFSPLVGLVPRGSRSDTAVETTISASNSRLEATESNSSASKYSPSRPRHDGIMHRGVGQSQIRRITLKRSGQRDVLRDFTIEVQVHATYVYILYVATLRTKVSRGKNNSEKNQKTTMARQVLHKKTKIIQVSCKIKSLKFRV